mgnify:FL=1
MNVLEVARQVINVESEALVAMAARLNGEFTKAVDLLHSTGGRVVVVGMGKSGIIGRKIAATFASTGTPSFSVHPGEAFHGDLGMIRPEDVVLMISNSGETEELIRLLPFFQYQRNKVVAMTGNARSTLAAHADAVLDISVEREACNNNLAPTSSTTATLVMGDALAVVLSTLRNFQPEDFARFHPGGNLGRQLLTRVRDVMHKTNLPFCAPAATFRDVVHAITRGRLGLALVMQAGSLAGIITDGDVRRAFDRTDNPMTLLARDIMTASPKIIDPDERFAVAEQRMKELKVNSLVVVDSKEQVVGVLQIFDMAGDTQALAQ